MNMNLLTFYKRILQLVAIFHIVLGVSFPFLMQVKAFSSFFLDQIFPDLFLSTAVYKQAAYLVGVFGPTVASWGVLLLVLVNSFYTHPTRQKWYGLLLAILGWYIADTIYSLMHGVDFALYINSFVVVSLLLPLFLSLRLVDLDNLES